MLVFLCVREEGEKKNKNKKNSAADCAMEFPYSFFFSRSLSLALALSSLLLFAQLGNNHDRSLAACVENKPRNEAQGPESRRC